MNRRRRNRRNRSVWALLLGGVLRGVAIAVFVGTGYVARAVQTAEQDSLAPHIELLMLFKRAAPDGWKMVRCKTNADRTKVETAYEEREES